MRILVLSDSHGNVENMARCAELTDPNIILHLGDCQRDAEALHRQLPAIPMQTVPGNCDWGAVDTPEVLTEHADDARPHKECKGKHHVSYLCR